MKRYLKLSPLVLACVLLAACFTVTEKAPLDPDLELAVRQSTTLERVVAIDYDHDNNIYYVVGVSPFGDIDMWYGEHASWTKLSVAGDMDVLPTGIFVDFAIGGGEAPDFGVGIGTNRNFRVEDGPNEQRCVSTAGQEVDDKAFFGGTDLRILPAVGTLVRCLSIDYDADNDQYYVVGRGPGGSIDVWYGSHDNWTQLPLDQDMDVLPIRSFVDFAIGGREAPDFGVGIGNNQNFPTEEGARERRCVSTAGQEVEGKASFPGNDLRALPAVGTLVRCLSIDYDADNDQYYVVGRGPGGDIDVWYGSHDNWTKLEEGGDIDDHYAPRPDGDKAYFVDFALGAEPEEAMFGVVIGNAPAYELGDGASEPRGTSINAREVADKAFFGDGGPVAVGAAP